VGGNQKQRGYTAAFAGDGCEASQLERLGHLPPLLRKFKICKAAQSKATDAHHIQLLLVVNLCHPSPTQLQAADESSWTCSAYEPLPQIE
jgi:hypothetical protein